QPAFFLAGQAFSRISTPRHHITRESAGTVYGSGSPAVSGRPGAVEQEGMAGAGSVAVWARSDDAGRNSGSKPVYVARGGIARRHRQMSVFALRLKAA